MATTSGLVWLLTLGTIYRRVVVDPGRDRMLIESRWLWFIHRKRTLRFSNIQAVTYGYEDLRLHGPLSIAHDTYDCFSVGVRLIDDSELRLFTFRGEGTFLNESSLPDWLFWDDYAFDLSGSQQAESRMFVELLAEMINVTVVPPRS